MTDAKTRMHKIPKPMLSPAESASIADHVKGVVFASLLVLTGGDEKRANALMNQIVAGLPAELDHTKMAGLGQRAVYQIDKLSKHARDVLFMNASLPSFTMEPVPAPQVEKTEEKKEEAPPVITPPASAAKDEGKGKGDGGNKKGR